MGYYTMFTLNAQDASRDKNGKLVLGELPLIIREDLDAEVDKMGVFEDGNCVDGWYCSEAKWYDHDEDMIALSHRFPDVLFTLYGDGEESDDMWYTYYLNGMSQDAPAQITYDDFDESKLVSWSNPELFSLDRRYSYE